MALDRDFLNQSKSLLGEFELETDKQRVGEKQTTDKQTAVQC